MRNAAKHDVDFVFAWHVIMSVLHRTPHPIRPSDGDIYDVFAIDSTRRRHLCIYIKYRRQQIRVQTAARIAGDSRVRCGYPCPLPHPTLYPTHARLHVLVLDTFTCSDTPWHSLSRTDRPLKRLRRLQSTAILLGRTLSQQKSLQRISCPAPNVVMPVLSPRRAAFAEVV